jgi:hypothetical protein
MKYLKVLFILLFLTGCAAQEPQEPVRQPSKLITKDDLEDLKLKKRKPEPVVVDYQEEGSYGQNFNPIENYTPRTEERKKVEQPKEEESDDPNKLNPFKR